jgi:hypothetical protein
VVGCEPKANTPGAVPVFAPSDGAAVTDGLLPKLKVPGVVVGAFPVPILNPPPELVGAAVVAPNPDDVDVVLAV